VKAVNDIAPERDGEHDQGDGDQRDQHATQNLAAAAFAIGHGVPPVDIEG
jgi:hypothetical protein